ncbi:uncharacterized protein V6R79_002649 [Siganus canaliculatus]
MVAAPAPSLVLLMLLAFGRADAIRLLKEGPMIDADGREYKSAAVKSDVEDFSQRPLSESSSVRVQCTETAMIITVGTELYKTGRPVSLEDIFFGTPEHWRRSHCQAVAAGDREFVIKVELQDCGSTLSMSGDYIMYTNSLIIKPAVTHPGITRKAHVVVPVSCFYKRTHTVSSHTWPQQQLPNSPAPAKPSESSAFSLKLMTNDWTSETSSRVFYLGDFLHLEAFYNGPDSRQRRLFIDSCVATLSPDVTSVPRYYVIENHGCLTDAKEGGLDSLFRPRQKTHSLQLRLRAFLFHQDSRNSIFITCQLKATSERLRNTRINKACNYMHSRWKNVDGSDHVCRCCDATCYETSPKRDNKTHLRRQNSKETCAAVTIGPLTILPSK